MARLNRTRLGQKFSEGARQVWLAIERLGIEQAGLARLLATGDENISRWIYGDRLPSRAMARRIRGSLGIDEALWDTPPAEAFIPPAARES